MIFVHSAYTNGVPHETARDAGRKPTEPDLTFLLRRCASLRAARSGREVHALMLRREYGGLRAHTALVKFYAECGSLPNARRVFDEMPNRDVVLWTTMLNAYSNAAEPHQGSLMALLREMLLSSAVAPNYHTLTVALRRSALEQGKQIHARIVKIGWATDPFVGASLVDLYARNGILGSARLVFDWIQQKDAVCYNGLISRYARIRDVEGLVALYTEMVSVGLEPNQSTFVGLLNGCASFGSMCLAKLLHAHAVKRGFNSDGVVQGVVVDMYAKCGDLSAARVAFDRIADGKSVVAWNSIICGFGKHGYTAEALELFGSMESASVSPDHITFTCLLSACSHSGFVDEGWRLFELMTDAHGISARDEHYCCMVDLLGRAGMVRAAYEFICACDHELGASVWASLLSACRVLGEAEFGEVAARKLFALEPGGSGSYVALAGIFAAKKRWDDACTVRRLMDGRGIRKEPGYSWIETEDGVVHKFRSGE